MIPIRYGQVPACCLRCKNLEFDSKDEYSPNYYYCTSGIKLPIKKLTCKRRSIDDTNNEQHSL